MAITVGVASSSTGLAGRIRSAIATAFGGRFSIAVGDDADKGLNAYAQGIVDALNNDKLSLATQAATAVASAHVTVAQNLAGGNAVTIVNFDTVDYDSDGAVTTGAAWHFTVPAGKAGLYKINAQIDVTAVPANGQIDLDVYLNGVYTKRLQFIFNVGAAAQFFCLNGSIDLKLAVGDAVSIRGLNGAAGALALNLDAHDNYVCISGPWAA